MPSQRNHRSAQPHHVIPVKRVSCLAIPFLLLCTLNIYWVFWLYRVVKELHSRGATELTPGKAVGFLFIPFFNFGWFFVVFTRLAAGLRQAYEDAELERPADTSALFLLPVGLLIAFVVDAVAPPWGALLGWILASGTLCVVQSLMNALADHDESVAQDGRSGRRVHASRPQVGRDGTAHRSDRHMLECPACTSTFHIRASHEVQGKRAKCNRCGHVFVINLPDNYDVTSASPAAVRETDCAYRPIGDRSEGIGVTLRGLRRLIADRAIDPGNHEYRMTVDSGWRPVHSMIAPAPAGVYRGARLADGPSKVCQPVTE